MTKKGKSLRQAGAEENKGLAKIKDDFLKLTVHELRRPLALLNGHYSMIEDGSYAPVPEGMRAGLQQIGMAMQDMHELLDGLAEVIALEDSATILKREPNKLGPLLQDAVASVRAAIIAQGTSIELKLPDSEVTAWVDRSRLLIAIVNLLSNAIQYSPKGSTVTMELRSEENRITIVVSDQGQGIGPLEAARIFEAWQRMPTSRVPGLGLGLYISQQIVSLHGGQLTLDSRPGQGSRFAIELPLQGFGMK